MSEMMHRAQPSRLPIPSCGGGPALIRTCSGPFLDAFNPHAAGLRPVYQLPAFNVWNTSPATDAVELCLPFAPSPACISPPRVPRWGGGVPGWLRQAFLTPVAVIYVTAPLIAILTPKIQFFTICKVLVHCSAPFYPYNPMW